MEDTFKIAINSSIGTEYIEQIDKAQNILSLEKSIDSKSKNDNKY